MGPPQWEGRPAMGRRMRAAPPGRSGAEERRAMDPQRRKTQRRKRRPAVDRATRDERRLPGRRTKRQQEGEVDESDSPRRG